MEKENKKLRDAERKKRNETVRVRVCLFVCLFVCLLLYLHFSGILRLSMQQLVAFVRKRDKRVEAYKVHIFFAICDCNCPHVN